MIWFFFYSKLKAKSVNTYTCSCHPSYKQSVLEILDFFIFVCKLWDFKNSLSTRVYTCMHMLVHINAPAHT